MDCVARPRTRWSGKIHDSMIQRFIDQLPSLISSEPGKVQSIKREGFLNFRLRSQEWGPFESQEHSSTFYNKCPRSCGRPDPLSQVKGQRLSHMVIFRKAKWPLFLLNVWFVRASKVLKGWLVWSSPCSWGSTCRVVLVLKYNWFPIWDEGQKGTDFESKVCQQTRLMIFNMPRQHAWF